MPRRKQRVYWRRRGGEPRAYGDFRDYSDVGGGLQALIPAGLKQATVDPEIAEKLASDLLAGFQEARRKRVILGVRRTATLGPFVDEHLEAKESEDVTYRWLQQTRMQLQEAVEFYGSERELSTIRVSDVREYLEHLGSLPGRCGKPLSGGSIRHYLNSLGNLYRRAVAEEVVNFNPVSALMHKPTAERKEADWLEIPEAAKLLKVAREYEPDVEAGAIPFMHEILTTFLLTGGRKKEVLGLRTSDVDFQRGTVTFRPNEYRRLKTRTSHRTLPLWPQLSAVLQPYASNRPIDGLLFPSPESNGKDLLLTDIRRQLDLIGKKAGFPKGRIRTKLFRHTYCSARLQTLDNGAPVAVFTVARELGHSSTAMVEKVYSHLGQIRVRSHSVEFTESMED